MRTLACCLATPTNSKVNEVVSKGGYQVLLSLSHLLSVGEQLWVLLGFIPVEKINIYRTGMAESVNDEVKVDQSSLDCTNKQLTFMTLIGPFCPWYYMLWEI